MAISIKNAEEVEKMRIAGRLAADVLQMVEPHVKAGISTDELDHICHKYIVNEQEAVPAPLNYHGFPKSICTSVNHVVCHGIPGEKRLKNGDIINIDITVIKNGFHGDTSKMFFIGEPSVRAKRLVDMGCPEWPEFGHLGHPIYGSSVHVTLVCVNCARFIPYRLDNDNHQDIY